MHTFASICICFLVIVLMCMMEEFKHYLDEDKEDEDDYAYNMD